MPCDSAIIKDVYTLSPDLKVADALKFIHEKDVRAMPVIDKDGRLVGVFSLSVMLKNLLPAVAKMEDGLQKLGFVVGASTGIAKRLQKEQLQTVAETMEKDVTVAHPSTALWEIIRIMVKYGSPVPIIEEDTGIFVGIVSEQSATRDLEQRIAALTPKDNEE